MPSADWKPAHEAGSAPSWDRFDSGKQLHDNIALIRVLDPTILPGGRGQHAQPAKHPATADQDAVQRLEMICRRLSLGTAVEHKGRWLAKGSGKSMSTTWDRRDGKLTGLHIDRWERRSLEALPLARNRVCLNLGPRARWLVFLTMELAELAAMSGQPATGSLTTSQAVLCLKKRPQTPVYRLRVEPGEAYVAPTERLMHDGQASSKSGEWVYTMFGRFERTEEAMKLSVI